MNNRFCYILAAALLMGCGQTKTVSVEVPEVSAINQGVDSLLTQRPAELPRASIETLPVEVRTYVERDAAPASPVTAIVADRDKITVRTPDREITYRQPATGETLVLKADSIDFSAGVAGRQEKRTVEVDVREQPMRILGVRAWIFAVIVILTLVVVIKLLR